MKKVLHAFSNLFSSGKRLSIEDELRAFAIKKYPNNLQAQEYIFKEELISYKHMKTASDSEAKEIARRQYPDDYTMQEYIYKNQKDAKKYMNSIEDSEYKNEAIKRYPKDYFTQKFVYGLLSKTNRRSA